MEQQFTAFFESGHRTPPRAAIFGRVGGKYPPNKYSVYLREHIFPAYKEVPRGSRRVLNKVLTKKIEQWMDQGGSFYFHDGSELLEPDKILPLLKRQLRALQQTNNRQAKREMEKSEREKSTKDKQRRRVNNRRAYMKKRNQHLVLCLGMSFPFRSGPVSLERVLRERQENTLQLHDARDLARLVKLEEVCNVRAMTVSMQVAGEYQNGRHVYGNFNCGRFLRRLANSIPRETYRRHFRQITLDYFWCPDGTWAAEHWGPNFFSKTIPALCNYLEIPNKEVKFCEKGFGIGCIYLPVNSTTLDGVTEFEGKLSKVFNLSITTNLSECMLFHGTACIDDKVMNTRLGKEAHQGHKYSRLGTSTMNLLNNKDTTTKVFPRLRSLLGMQAMIRLQRKA